MKRLFLALLLPASLLAAPSLHLTWRDNSDNERAFEIQRSTDAENYETLRTVDANVTEWEDDSVEPGVTYFYRVRAANEYGYSGFSNVLEVEMGDVPDDPSELQGDAQPTLSFEIVDGQTVIVRISDEN